MIFDEIFAICVTVEIVAGTVEPERVLEDGSAGILQATGSRVIASS